MATNDEESLEQFLPAPKIVKQIKDMQNHKQSSKKKSGFPLVSWETIFAETHKRYKKYGYNGYLGHLKAIQEWVEEAGR